MFVAGGTWGCEAARPDSELLLIVSSSQALDVLEFNVRTQDYTRDTLTESVRDRDLDADPFVLSLPRAALTQDMFLVHIKGLRNGAVIAQASVLTEVAKGITRSQKVVLRRDFIDVDGDGYEACSDLEGCDCDDADENINPFSAEICGDQKDNNCSGWPADEGCTCVPGSAPVPCTALTQSLWGLAGVGACAFGELRCIDGVLESECVSGLPQDEIANNYIDDDCDGSIDEGSTCSPGVERACLLGFVDDPANPDVAARLAASQRALGVCQAGSQVCRNSGTWGSCEGAIEPQKDLVTNIGYAETTAQCDGLDNDCDGVVDDEVYFDVDGDGYTFCGTCRDPSEETSLCDVSVDCNDTDAAVHPGMSESCVTPYDDDCRCDHDPEDRAFGAEGSVIGLPSVRTDGTQNCDDVDPLLDCGRRVRSPNYPTGDCADAPDAYYQGYFFSAQDCHYCGASFGLSCDQQTGLCRSKATDCDPCVAAPPTNNATLAEARLICTGPASEGTHCSGLEGPDWVDLADEDPFADCGAIDCGDYFSEIRNGRCFPKGVIPSGDVDCMANPPSGIASCEDDIALCPDFAGEDDSFFPPPSICAQLDPQNPGCAQDSLGVPIPPRFVAQALGLDLFDDCNESFSCGIPEPQNGGGPFYHGLVDTTADGEDNPECFLKADVASQSCDGNFVCQGRAQECAASGIGAIVPDRPLCQGFVSNSCVGETGPVYEPIPPGADPYDECPGTCDGASACHLQRGDACGVGSLTCEAGLNCVDGFCCDSAGQTTCGTCERCDQAGSLGTCTGIDAESGIGCTGVCDRCVGGSCDPRSLGEVCHTDGACDGASSCKDANGESCTDGNDCATGNCSQGYCCDAACSGPCESCDGMHTGGSNGACTPVVDKTDPKNTCGDYVCRNEGGMPVQCHETCTNDGFCKENVSHCNSDSDGNAGICVPDLDPGESCVADTDCADGVCSAENVCCDTECADTCRSCEAENTESSDGTCALVTANTDPNNNCNEYTCTAAGACPTNCDVDGDAACDTAANFVCIAQEGESSECLLPRSDGAACAENADCANAHCFILDGESFGICCDVACDGVCASCLGAHTGGSDGVCANVSIQKDPKNSCTDLFACAGDGTCSASPCSDATSCEENSFCGQGVCTDGTFGSLCDDSSDCDEGTCTDGFCCAVADCGDCQSCNASGVCEPDESKDTNCNNFVCQAGACMDTCSVSAGCQNTFICDQDECVAALKSDGALCKLGTACSSGICSSTAGECQQGGSGDPCLNNSDCNASFPVCDDCGDAGDCNDVDGQCSVSLLNGADCGEDIAADSDCTSGHCDMATNKCVDGTVNAACTNDLDCALANHCNLNTSMCEADLANASGCTRNEECINTCLGSVCGDKLALAETCVENIDCASGHCWEARVGGAQCVDGALASGCDDDVDCASGSYCVNNACSGGSPGDHCNQNNDCDSGYCDELDALQCTEGSAGESCDDNNDCMEGRCDDCDDTDADCTDPDGSCAASLGIPQGQACGESSDCVSNLCIHGYCCNSACDTSGIAMCCNVSGAEGVCTIDAVSCSVNP